MDTAGMILNILSAILLIAGAITIMIGSLGVLRFPDFFTRIHAAGITDTTGSLLLFSGLIITAGLSLVTAKLVIILILLLFTSPTASHALAKAAVHAGYSPLMTNRDPETWN